MVKIHMKYIALIFIFANFVHASPLETVVKRFYSDLKALELRGEMDQNQTETIFPTLTPSLKQAFRDSQTIITGWKAAAKERPEAFRELKPPPDDGPIFTGVWEGGEFLSIASITEAGDRAYVVVSLSNESNSESVDRVDLLILHRIDSSWLIDDIVFSPDEKAPTTVRKRICYPLPPKPKS